MLIRPFAGDVAAFSPDRDYVNPLRGLSDPADDARIVSERLDTQAAVPDPPLTPADALTHGDAASTRRDVAAGGDLARRPPAARGH